MIADMHCHYPMRVVADAPDDDFPGRIKGSPKLAVHAMTRIAHRKGWSEKLRTIALRLVARHINNYGDDRWRVSLGELESGDVRGVFSVLYEPFAEFDFDKFPSGPLEAGYFGALVGLLEKVEQDLAGKGLTSVTDVAALDETIEAGEVAFMHCVEGGFHLGDDAKKMDEHVGLLAERGVVYITLAHLFWRHLATNAPAIPLLGDRLYNLIFPQPDEVGLSKRGEAAVEAMYEHGVLIDVSHMSERALDDTFALLEQLDRDAQKEPEEFPVIATHAGFRFGEQAYMLSPKTIRRIVERNGVIGLIMARHQLYDCAGVENPGNAAETPLVLYRHIDAIRRLVPSRSNAHVAIGSDLDGFIKPTVAGIESVADLASLREPLEQAYGEDAEAILSENALRMARRARAGRR